MIKGDDWKGTKKGMELEKKLAEVGVIVKCLPYKPDASNSVLRTVISNIY